MRRPDKIALGSVVLAALATGLVVGGLERVGYAVGTSAWLVGLGALADELGLLPWD